MKRYWLTITSAIIGGLLVILPILGVLFGEDQDDPVAALILSLIVIGGLMLAGCGGFEPAASATDTPAILRPSDLTFYFRHTLTQGNADSQFTWAGAGSGWLPVAGAFGLG